VSNFGVPCQGAVENVLERSTHLQLSDGSVEEMTEVARNAILAKLHGLSTKALRCLGLAYKYDLAELSAYDGESHGAHKLLLDPNNYDQIESGLIFVGMAGLRVSTPHVMFSDICRLF
jgi:Ca2+-transporting ATPase